jgi:hypothetical protein
MTIPLKQFSAVVALGEAIARRDSSALVGALDALTEEVGVEGLLDVLHGMPGADARFVAGHLALEVVVTESEETGELAFQMPRDDARWVEDRGDWELLS